MPGKIKGIGVLKYSGDDNFVMRPLSPYNEGGAAIIDTGSAPLHDEKGYQQSSGVRSDLLKQYSNRNADDIIFERNATMRNPKRK